MLELGNVEVQTFGVQVVALGFISCVTFISGGLTGSGCQGCVVD